MGGGGGFIGGLVGGLVGGVVNALGLAPKPSAPAPQQAPTSKQADAGANQATQGGAETPTGEASSGGKQAYGGMYASQRRMGASNAGGGSTMLTGPTGVEEKNLALGKRSLLGE